MRKEVMMEKLLKGSKAPTTSKLGVSPLLSKVKSFITEIKTANEELETLDKDSILIENVAEDAESYIEMVKIKNLRAFNS